MVEKSEIIYNYISKQLTKNPIDSREISSSSKYRDSFFRLKNCVDGFIEYGNDRSIIMPGLRGVGKTTLVYQLYDYLVYEKRIPTNQLLYINTDLISEFLGLSIFEVIDYFLKEFHDSYKSLEKKIFIFVDEAQFDEKWAITGKVLHDEYKNLFLLFTGSSALNLEISADLARRSSKIPIFPLNFAEYLNLKYDYKIPNGFSEDIEDLIFNRNNLFFNWDDSFSGDNNSKNDGSSSKKDSNECIKKIKAKESEFNRNQFNFDKPIKDEFNYFLKYGSFPYSIHKKTNNALDIVEKIIDKDMDIIQSTTKNTKSIAYQLVRVFSLKNPGFVSEEGLANKLNQSPSTIRKVLQILLKTHLFFQVSCYGGGIKQLTKPKEYFFISPSLKYCLCSEFGANITNTNAYMGALLENQVASTFFRLKKTTYKGLGLFYPYEKGSVDFILNDGHDNLIPVEVGIGKKDIRQVKHAISKYKADYGIIVSNKTSTIYKEDNILYLPPHLFALI